MIPPAAGYATTDDLLAKRDAIIETARGHLERSDRFLAAESLKALESATVDDRTLDLTDPWLSKLWPGYRVVASFDPKRVPGAGELVIIYGNYPHQFSGVVVNNPVKRHIADFWKFNHHDVESDRHWNGVDRIAIINAGHRRDRLDSVLRELTAVRAPIERVHLHQASVSSRSGGDYVDGQIGCLESHIAVLKAARSAACRNTLVLEDDFCFTSDVETHLADLAEFNRRLYSYWVCLIATSKYGEVRAKNDLVAYSHQACTNTGGYLISAEGTEKVLRVFEDALAKLTITRESNQFAVDRCWSVLQASGKFLVFRRKFGFQAASFSDIQRTISRYLD